MSLYLAGENGQPIGEAYDAAGTIVQRLDIRSDDTGDWSEDLVPNEEITPAGTVWARTVSGGGNDSTTYATVPTGAAVEWKAILTEPPASLASGALAIHEALRGPGGHLPDGPPGDNQVPVWDDALQDVVWEDVAGVGGEVTQAAFDAEVAARIAADEAEATTRGTADTTEAATRAAADTAEATARADADALLIPLTQKGAPSGVAPLDAGGFVAEAFIPDTIARDAEVQTLVDARIDALLNGASSAADTLAELEDLLGDQDTALQALITLVGTKANADASNIVAATWRTALGLVLGTDIYSKATVDALLSVIDTDLSTLEADLAAHLASATAHDAADLTYTPAITGELVAATVAAALDELDARTGSDGIFANRQRAEIVEDFLNSNTTTGQIGTCGWSVSSSGTGAGVVPLLIALGRPGVIELDTGTTTTGRCGLTLGALSLYGPGPVSYEWDIYVPQLKNAGVDEFIIRAGLGDGNGAADPTDGFYYEYSSADTTWHFKTANGGVRTDEDTDAVTQVSTWVRLKMVSDGILARYLVNGVEVANSPIISNLPGASAYYGPILQIVKTVGTTNVSLFADRFVLTYDIPR